MPVTATLVAHSQELPMTDKPKSKRGFAAMSPEKRREIASKGGSSVPADKRAFSRDRELASKAGEKGGHAGFYKGLPE